MKKSGSKLRQIWPGEIAIAYWAKPPSSGQSIYGKKLNAGAFDIIRLSGFDGTRWATRGNNLCFSERATLPPISEEKTFFRRLAAAAPPRRGHLAIDNAEKFAH
jgi:hypothetical protein